MIHVENLSLVLDGHQILNDVSFAIHPGEYVGLIGPNGAGKTSLIKTLLGVYVPTRGRVTRAPGVCIGYVPQQVLVSNVVPLSVREVLHMAGRYTDAALSCVLEKVELGASFLDKEFHTLSGGQQQRVVIARSLCQKPDMLLFDEPLTGVDYATKIKLYALLSSLNTSEGMTILFVSHEIDQVIAECHRVLCLNKTMHTGCHPMDFARGNTDCCPVLEINHQRNVLPVHHHHPSP